MTSRAIKILHVEDDESGRRLFAHQLQSMNDFQFEIHYADAEEAALEVFRSGGVEFVILDYNLRQGDGLHCLMELRNRDPIIPIIAMSGVATAEIAADLVEGGADDYISKRHLTSCVLASTIRDVLERSDAWRKLIERGTMSSRTIKILHVEDEESQRRLFAHHLRAMDDFQFEIHYADAEEAALEVFRSGGMEFVILDYNLRQGDGLHCLRELRRLDPIVPIIAISGVATAEIATDLVEGGADDYINKKELTSNLLARSMRGALIRVDAWREWNAVHPS